MKPRVWPVVAALMALWSGQASASPAAFTIYIAGYVPVVCHVTASTTLVDNSSGTANIGSVAEFCNNPTGYQVWVDYAPGVTSASINVNGTIVKLSSSGSTMIDSSSTAASLTRSLSLNGARGLGSISFRVVPI